MSVNSSEEFDALSRRAENKLLLDYLNKEQPSAHADMVDLLVKSADKLTGVGFFCPDADNYSYYLAHTKNGVVFASALGLSALVFWLPKQAVSGALQKGGKPFREFGENWIMFDPFWPERINTHLLEEMQHWCRLAYHHALALENNPGNL